MPKSGVSSEEPLGGRKLTSFIDFPSLPTLFLRYLFLLGCHFISWFPSWKRN